MPLSYLAGSAQTTVCKRRKFPDSFCCCCCYHGGDGGLTSGYAALSLSVCVLICEVRRDKRVLELIDNMFHEKKPIAAICHGPWLLCSSVFKHTKGIRSTCFSAIRDDVENAGSIYEDSPVVVDQNIITSRHPDDLIPFCRAIIDALSPNMSNWQSLSSIATQRFSAVTITVDNNESANESTHFWSTLTHSLTMRYVINILGFYYLNLFIANKTQAVRLSYTHSLPIYTKTVTMPGKHRRADPQEKALRMAENINNTRAKHQNRSQLLDPSMLTPSKQVKEGFMSLSELRRHGSKKR